VAQFNVKVSDLKQLLIALLFRSGLFALWRHWNRKRITILALHGVTGRHTSASWTPLWERPTTERIALVLKQLSSHYTYISIQDAVSILDGSAPAVDHGLVVTFDDGYRNNFTEALPVLEELGVPASFFVATGYVESGRSYWVDRMDYALQHAPDDRRLLKCDGYEFDFRGLDHDELAEAYRKMRVSLKRNERNDEDLLRIVDSFCEFLESGSETTISDVIETDAHAAIATWAEQGAACAKGVTIGSHTVDHFRLTSIPESDVDRQVVDSKNEIERNLKIDCEYFCYPNGNLDDFVRDRVAEAKYRAAVASRKGRNSPGDDLFRLKRYSMPLSENLHKNLLQISGIFESRIVKALR
jgi:peptidoglycan/xylan/chitin deacetylase (PgdA/CDA1 family)